MTQQESPDATMTEMLWFAIMLLTACSRTTLHDPEGTPRDMITTLGRTACRAIQSRPVQLRRTSSTLPFTSSHHAIPVLTRDSIADQA